MSRLFFKNYTNDDSLQLYGRDILLKKINAEIVSKKSPENIALLGVRGVGKTSIIKKAFGSNKTEEYFRENKIVVVHIRLPETADSMKSFYSYLNNAILQGLDTIEKFDAQFYKILMDEIVQAKNKVIARSLEIDEATTEVVLNKTIELIQKHALHLLLVFDDFEKFADSSIVKRTQYKYMRDFANSGKGTLFISTGKDLVKVSEEIKGSGFENIFQYVELRGLRELAIGDWIDDVLEEANVEFSDNAVEWIADISGGIPEIVCIAGEVVFECIEKNFVFLEDECYRELFHRVTPLMKQWWEYIDEQERSVLKTVHEGISEDTIVRNNLIKKGYLEQDDDDGVSFNTKLFEDYAIEMWNLQEEIKDEKNEETINTEDVLRLFQYLKSYKGDNANTSIDQFGRMFQDDVRNILSNPTELFVKWNLTLDIWSKIPKERQHNLVMAYTLGKFGFNEEDKSLNLVDCRPVVVMLGNFLEGFLNDCINDGLKKYLSKVKFMMNGRTITINEATKFLTIGNYKMIWKDLEAVLLSNIDQKILSRFYSQLEECHAMRNHCDHPGEIVTYDEQKKYIQNLFDGENSMVRILVKIKEVLK